MDVTMTFSLDDIRAIIATRYGIMKEDVRFDEVLFRNGIGENWQHIDRPDLPNQNECLRITVELRSEPFLSPHLGR